MKKRIYIYVTIIIIGFTFIKFLDLFCYQKLKNGRATVGITLDEETVSNGTLISYVYKVNDIKYIGKMHKFPIKDIKVPNGKYIVVYNKKNPEISALIVKKEVNNLKVDFDTVIIENSLIKDALRNAGICKARKLSTIEFFQKQ